MNEMWQGITPSLGLCQIMGTDPMSVPPTLAQITTLDIASFFPLLWDIAIAVLILVVGFIVAKILAGVARGILKRTKLDNKIAGWVAGRADQPSTLQTEKWISDLVFWLIVIFAFVGFLDALKLQVVSQPLNNFLSQILIYLPRIASAGILLVVAWVLATIVKMVVTRALNAWNFDRQVCSQTGGNQLAVSNTLANALYWFIFLLFLPSVLNTLQLEGTLEPVQGLLDEFLSILPDMVAAGLIAAAGWLVATVVRRIVTNLLLATNVDQLGSRFGLSPSSGSQTLSWLVGTIVYVLVLIPIAIAALNTVGIEAISAPAVAMLEDILGIIPLLFVAGLIVVISYAIGRFVSDLVTNILTGFGFNNIFSWLGLQSAQASETQSSPNGEQTLLQKTQTKTPSEIVGTIVLVAIMLFATITATDILGLNALTLILGTILQIAAQVLVGVVVFAIGLAGANFVKNLIISSGTSQRTFLGQAAYIAIIILVGAMALQRMGIAPDIVNLAFGLLLGAIAVAIALAFGLGARDIAGEQLNEWLAAFKGDKTPRS
ncbi:MAG: mechanosensitive ion channel [Hormoscilla sp. SP5CHS1]|nr:mechanosensitive ion channel [Hormoscilla sp. SP5CHS1]